MDVDPSVGQLIDDPELLQQLVEKLPDESKDGDKEAKDKKPDDASGKS